MSLSSEEELYQTQILSIGHFELTGSTLHPCITLYLLIEAPGGIFSIGDWLGSCPYLTGAPGASVLRGILMDTFSIFVPGCHNRVICPTRKGSRSLAAILEYTNTPFCFGRCMT